MNAFSGLAQLSQVSINAVAPGISEALVATALGLFAAIPALISYNWSVKSIDSIIKGYENFSDELLISYHDRDE
jgi:biopolymer transport protein TolQ